MFKWLMLLTALLCGQAVADVKSALISATDINAICPVADGGYQYRKGGFPMLEDKYAVTITDNHCGFRIYQQVFQLVGDHFANDKLNNLLAAARQAGIPLVQDSRDKSLYVWQTQPGRYALLGRKGKLVFDVFYAVDPQRESSVRKLVLTKYNSL